jgi:hypothetical protein
MSENTVLRRIFEPLREEVRGDERELHERGINR